MDQTDAPPIAGARGSQRATASDAAELLVLQRCCWVDEALANETLDIPAFHESLDDVRSWIAHVVDVVRPPRRAPDRRGPRPP